MLKTVRAEIFSDPRTKTLAETMRLLLQGALVHFDVLHPALLRDADYCGKEGFGFLDSYFQGLIKRALESHNAVKGGGR